MNRKSPSYDLSALTRQAPVAFVCLIALMFASTVPAQEAAPNYKLRGDAASALGKFRTLTEGSQIPLNRRYSALSPSERKILNELWENIPEGDEPPFPISGLKPIHAAMAKAQEALSVEGPLDLIASVNAEGEVTEVKAIGSPSPEMTKYAAAVLFNTKFKPAICAGKTCAMQFPFSFLFKRD